MALLFIGLLLLTEIGLAKADSGQKEIKSSSSLHFTLADKHGFPSDQDRESFDCLDKIYAVTEIQGFKQGKHSIEFRWVDPEGSTRERTEYDFHVSDKPVTKLWAWLELSRARGAGIIQWLNPAAGLEEFIGEWELELFVNGKRLNKGAFEVSC